MWLYSPRKPHHVGILISDNHMHLSCITHAASGYALRAYHRHELTRGEIIDGIPFQPARLISYIHNFIIDNNLTRPIITYALDDRPLYKTITTHQPDVNHTRLILSSAPLHTSDVHESYYTVGIQREIIFYYQLIAMALRNPCPMITTIYSCYITALTASSRNQPSRITTIGELESSFDELLANPIISMHNASNITPCHHAALIGLYMQGSHIV